MTHNSRNTKYHAIITYTLKKNLSYEKNSIPIFTPQLVALKARLFLPFLVTLW